jgi:acyl carrier protein
MRMELQRRKSDIPTGAALVRVMRLSVASIPREQIEETIREILIAELELDPGRYGANISTTPLLGRGIGLDSIDALTLVAAIEKRFDIEVYDSDLTVGLFKTIRTLAEYVSHRTSD